MASFHLEDYADERDPRPQVLTEADLDNGRRLVEVLFWKVDELDARMNVVETLVDRLDEQLARLERLHGARCRRAA